MALLDGLAQKLDDLGLVDYRPNAVGGDCFCEWQPPTPDEIVTVWAYAGPESDGGLALDFPNVQIRTRSASSTASRARLQVIFDALHGYAGVLPDGTAVELMMGSLPTPIGPDDSGRFEHVANFRTIVRREAAELAGRD